MTAPQLSQVLLTSSWGLRVPCDSIERNVESTHIYVVDEVCCNLSAKITIFAFYLSTGDIGTVHKIGGERLDEFG